MANKYPDGGLSSVIIGREGTTSPIADRSNMVPLAFAFNSWNVDEQTETEEDASLRGSRSPSPPGDGVLSAAGTAEMNLTLVGMMHWLQALMGDPSPESVAHADKLIVPAATDITTVAAATFFSATTDITITPVDGVAIDTAGSIAFTDDLASYEDSVELTVTPGGTPTLTDPAVDASIDITYRDNEGNEDTIELVFTDSDKTTAQMATIPANSRITDIEVDGWSAGDVDVTATIAANLVRQPAPNQPGRINIVLSAPIANGKIIIKGKRRVGLGSDQTLQQNETIQLDATGTDFTTDKFFHRIDSIRFEDDAGAVVTTGSVTIYSQPDTYETVIELSDDIHAGLTAEAELAEIPRRYKKLRVQSGTINVGTPNNMSLTFLGERVDDERTIEGGDEQQFVATRKQHPNDFPFVDRAFFPSWGGYIEIDDTALIFDSTTINVDQGLEFSGGKTASRFQTDVQTLTRIITSTISTYFYTGTAAGDVYTNWQEKFRDGEFSKVKVVIYAWPAKGRQYEMTFIMENVLVTAPVPLNITERGRVSRDISVQSYTSEGVATPDDIKVILVSTDQWS